MEAGSTQNMRQDGPGRGHAVVCAALIAIVLAVHGGALGDGLFLDDRLHQIRLRDADWSWSSLLSSATIDSGQFIDTWWQTRPLRWDYSRPLAMAWMKLIEWLADGSVWPQHIPALVFHCICALLVYVLCTQLGGRRRWAAIAAMLFAIYPHAVYAVSWLAAENAVMQTMLTLAAMVLYIRASGLEGSPQSGLAGPPERLRPATFCGVVLLYTASLLCRESAVVLPVLLLSLDWTCAGWKCVRQRWPAYLVLGVITLGFLWWRLWIFPGGIPAVYLRRPDGDGYVWWYLAKLLHYVTSTIWITPMFIGPTGRPRPWSEVPGDCWLMVTIVLVLGVGYWRACRGTIRHYWIWPLWIVLAVLPVVPILATPHSGYMPGVGFVMALVARPAVTGARRAPISTAVVGWFVLTSLSASLIYRTCWRGVVRAEQAVVAQMSVQAAPPAAADVFLINLPLANIYLPLLLQEQWGAAGSGSCFHALTFAPDVLMGPDDCEVRQCDAYSFDLALGKQRYLSGLLGQFLVEGMSDGKPWQTGDQVKTEQYDVDILKGDSSGVQAIRFTFPVPLSSAANQFYIVLEDQPGCRLQFVADVPAGGVVIEPECTVLAEARRCEQERGGLFRALEVTSRIIQTDLYLTGPPRLWPGPAPAESVIGEGRRQHAERAGPPAEGRISSQAGLTYSTRTDDEEEGSR